MRLVLTTIFCLGVFSVFGNAVSTAKTFIFSFKFLESRGIAFDTQNNIFLSSIMQNQNPPKEQSYINVFNPLTGKNSKTYQYCGLANDLVLSPNNRYMYVGGGCGLPKSNVQRILVATGKTDKYYQIHPESGLIALSSDGKTMAMASTDGTLLSWDTETNKIYFREQKAPGVYDPVQVPSGGLANDYVYSALAYHPNNNIIAATGLLAQFGEGVVFYNAKTGKEIKTLEPKISPATQAKNNIGNEPSGNLSFSKMGKYLAAGCTMSDCPTYSAFVWNTETGKIILRLHTSSSKPIKALFVKNDKYIITSQYLRDIDNLKEGRSIALYDYPRVWNTKTGKLVKKLSIKAGVAAISPDGTRIALIQDKVLHIMSLNLP